MKHNEERIERILITGVGAKSSMRRALRQYHEEMAAPMLAEIERLKAGLLSTHYELWAETSTDTQYPGHPMLPDVEGCPDPRCFDKGFLFESEDAKEPVQCEFCISNPRSVYNITKEQ